MEAKDGLKTNKYKTLLEIWEQKRNITLKMKRKVYRYRLSYLNYK